MAICTTSDVFKSECYSKFIVIAGKTVGYPRCRICGEKIKKGTYVVACHTFGEAPSYFHSECSKKIIADIGRAIEAIEKAKERHLTFGKNDH